MTAYTIHATQTNDVTYRVHAGTMEEALILFHEGEAGDPDFMDGETVPYAVSIDAGTILASS